MATLQPVDRGLLALGTSAIDFLEWKHTEISEQVTIHHSPTDTGKVSDPSELKLYWWDGSGWQDAAQTCDPASTIIHDEVNRVISIPICHLSRFALLGPGHRIYLPLVLRGS